MQTLDAYLAGADAQKLTQLSEAIGISKSRLSQLRHSVEWPPHLALKLEEATAGAVDASFLSPVIAAARRTAQPGMAA